MDPENAGVAIVDWLAIFTFFLRYTARAGGGLMTQPEPETVSARVAREYEQCQRQVAGTEAELKRIGAAFVELGNKLQTDPSSISPDRLLVEKDIAVLWLLLPEYIQALKNREEKKAELDRLKGKTG